MGKNNLEDVTFTIPVRYDTDDRIKNITFVIEFLRYHFDTNILVLEEAKEKKFDWVDAEYIFNQTDDPNLHRTKCLNDMAKISKTPYIVNYDTDVVLDPQAYITARDLLKENKAEMVYPYAGKFFDVPRKYLNILRENEYDVSKIKMKDIHLNHPESLGGAIFWNKEKFIEIGMENENFKSWGWEDNERFYRSKKLGVKIKRTEGHLYHLTHERLEDSRPKNRHYNNNMIEMQKIKDMSADKLKNLVQKWKWCNDG